MLCKTGCPGCLGQVNVYCLFLLQIDSICCADSGLFLSWYTELNDDVIDICCSPAVQLDDKPDSLDVFILMSSKEGDPQQNKGEDKGLVKSISKMACGRDILALSLPIGEKAHSGIVCQVCLQSS